MYLTIVTVIIEMIVKMIVTLMNKDNQSKETNNESEETCLS